LKNTLLALKNVAEARRNLVDAVNGPDSDWENCYQLLVQGKTPTLQAIATLLSKLGLKLSVTVKQEQVA
jgi:DNA-binding phage protein